MFGHVKGSFSGAIVTKQGLFEAVHKGTLFLDEIGNLSLETQGKLLRTLETKHVRKVGDTTERGRYPPDLRHEPRSDRNGSGGQVPRRLVLPVQRRPIRLPPLRERTGDIPLLATAFLDRFCKKNQVAVKGFSTEAMTLMEGYPWPGNVRELRNIVEHWPFFAIMTASSRRNLPEEIRRAMARARRAALPRSGEEFKRFKQQTVQQMERRFLRDALERCDGNFSRAAEQIGIQRTNLHALLKKLGPAS